MSCGSVLSMSDQRFTGFFNKLPVLNMPGLRIWQGCEYARVTRVLNMPDYVLIMSQYA